MAAVGRGLVALFKSADELASADDPYITILKENQFSGFLVQTLSFQFFLENLKECLTQPNRYSGMILTSQRSVESVKKAIPNLPSEWNTKRHYCVGMKTAETTSKLLGATNIAGQNCGNADNLSLLIVEDFQKGHLPLPLLFPCSSLKMDTLPRTLKKYDIPADIVTSYVTVSHPYLRESIFELADKVPDYLVFFSPSGVSFSLPFLRERNLFSKAKIVSIGSTTARALEDADISIHRICVKPTPEDLMEALISLNKEPTIG